MYIKPNRGILFDAIHACILSAKRESCRITAEIPPITAPFFMEREGMDAPILSFFKAHIHSVDGWEGMAELLGEDDARDDLRGLVYEALFGQEAPISEDTVCSVKTAALLDGTSFSAEFKYRALLCLSYFRHGVSELCRTLGRMAEAAEELHRSAESETEALLSTIRAGKYDSLYRSAAGIDLSGAKEITVSVSILRPDTVLSFAKEGEVSLVVGLRHVDALLRTMEEDAVDVEIFLEDMGNALRRMILEALSKEASMTASDISRKTGIPVTTVLRHMEALSEHYIIRISERRGMQIFYTVNRAYLEKAHRKTDKYLHSLFGGEIIEERNEN